MGYNKKAHDPGNHGQENCLKHKYSTEKPGKSQDHESLYGYPGLFLTIKPESAESLRKYGFEAAPLPDPGDYEKRLGGKAVYLFDENPAILDTLTGLLSPVVSFLKIIHLSNGHKTIADLITDSEKKKLSESQIRLMIADMIGTGEKQTGEPDKAEGKKKQKQEKTPQAELLLEIAKGLDFYHDDGGNVYANLPVDNHHEFTPLNGRFFKDWLSNQYYYQKGCIANSEAITAALRVLNGQGRYNSPEVNPCVRLAENDKKIFLDLCNPQREVVEISKAGWRVVSEYPVFFRRPKGCLALPTPKPGGKILDLKRHLNVKDDASWRLIVAWVIQSLNPHGPYPILVINGEQGTAKSTLSRFLRSIVDPNIAPLRSLPRSERDLAIACSNSWIQVLENVSCLPDWLSDALCRLSTGGGFSTRTLYENDEETLFASKRPIILNGICNFVTRHDLADRSLMVHLDFIPDEKRLPESQLRSKFENSASYILGAFLDAVSEALRNIETVKLAKLPRMADFALWVSAAEPALPWEPGGFIETYDAKRAETVRDAVESSPLGAAILKLMDTRESWEGTPSELLTKLEDVTDEKTRKSKAWPGNVLWLGRRLVEISSFLRKVGIEITDDRDSKTRLLKITKNVVTLVTVVIDQENQALTNDKKDDKKDFCDKKTGNVVTDNIQLNQYVDKNDKNDKKKHTLSKSFVDF